MIVANCWFFS